MGRKRPGKPPVQKIVDETIYLKRPRHGAKLKEEVWQTEDGEVVKYSLAHIDPSLCAQFYEEVRELWRKEDEERRKGHS